MVPGSIGHMGSLGGELVVGHQGGRLQPLQGAALLAGSHIPLNCTCQTTTDCQISAHEELQISENLFLLH